MKISVENLGPIKQAELELKDLTIICGENNTGKTYLAHTLSYCLQYLNPYRSHRSSSLHYSNLFYINEPDIKKLLSKKQYTFSIEINKIQEHFNTLLKDYFKNLVYKDFAAKKYLFSNTTIKVQVISSNLLRKSSTSEISSHLFYKDSTDDTAEVGSVSLKCKFKVSENNESLEIQISLIESDDSAEYKSNVTRLINSRVYRRLIRSFVPNLFVVSAERSGASMFQPELDFTRSNFVDTLRDEELETSPEELLNEFKGGYPKTVQDNINYFRSIPSQINKESFLAEKHPEILSEFNNILGGEYVITDVGVRFIPKGSKDIALSLSESSSTVRTLQMLGFYLKHSVRKRDILVIDEPELNLHPQNQRLLARLFARLVNAGIKILISTHSDYIIKELNTLIMLNHSEPQVIQNIQNKYGYSKDELLPMDRTSMYMTQKIPNDDETPDQYTLKRAEIYFDVGFAAESFDETIDIMEEIQDEILFQDE